jgi:ribosomal protein S18 acetylase RimI-like enzyme
MEQPVVRDGTVADLAAIGAIEADVSWPVEDYLAYQLDVAEIEGEVVGFLVTRRLVEGEAEILNLAVGSGFRRRGVARVLLEKACEPRTAGLSCFTKIWDFRRSGSGRAITLPKMENLLRKGLSWK